LPACAFADDVVAPVCVRSRSGSTLKFHLQAPTANIVTGSGPGWVRVGANEYRENVVLLPDDVVTGWAPEGFDALSAADFERLLSYNPEIVLLGTGASQRFPHPRLLSSLTSAHVGVEVMDTRAACRTFNILVAEGRRVAAALSIA
jgi:uncharacterized protein